MAYYYPESDPKWTQATHVQASVPEEYGWLRIWFYVADILPYQEKDGEQSG